MPRLIKKSGPHYNYWSWLSVVSYCWVAGPKVSPGHSTATARIWSTLSTCSCTSRWLVRALSWVTKSMGKLENITQQQWERDRGSTCCSYKRD